MLKVLKDAKPVLKREEWIGHIRKYEKLKNHLQGKRHKSPPNSTSIFFPALQTSRGN